MFSTVLPSKLMSSKWGLPPNFQFRILRWLRRSTRLSSCVIKQWGLKSVESAGSGEDYVSGLGKPGSLLYRVFLLKDWAQVLQEMVGMSNVSAGGNGWLLWVCVGLSTSNWVTAEGLEKCHFLRFLNNFQELALRKLLSSTTRWSEHNRKCVVTKNEMCCI